jgi:hypothetical protein
LSGVIAMFVFLGLFKAKVNGMDDVVGRRAGSIWGLNEKYISHIKENPHNLPKNIEYIPDFFAWMGIFIGALGFTAGTIYMIASKKKVEEPKPIVDEETPLINNNIDVENGNIDLVSEGGKKIKPETPKKEEKKPAGVQKTLWLGVLGVFLIMIFGENFGLAFNGLIATHFEHSLRTEKTHKNFQSIIDKYGGEEKFFQITNIQQVQAIIDNVEKPEQFNTKVNEIKAKPKFSPNIIIKKTPRTPSHNVFCTPAGFFSSFLGVSGLIFFPPSDTKSILPFSTSILLLINGVSSSTIGLGSSTFFFDAIIYIVPAVKPNAPMKIPIHAKKSGMYSIFFGKL